MKTLFKAALPLLGLLCLDSQQARSQIEINRTVVAAAPVAAQNTTYRVTATLGQAAIGTIGAAQRKIDQGFWHTLPRPAAAAITHTSETDGLSISASPMPFAEFTEISIRLPQREQVSLVIYDLLGKPVRMLIDSEQLEGRVNLSLYAEDLPSGRYTASLTAGNEQRTIPLLIVR